MKTLLFLPLALISLLHVSSHSISAQCETEYYEFDTQAQIDNFAVAHPGCTEVGGITVSGMDIVSLEGLGQITTVNYDVSISNTGITNLHGLDHLKTIHGSLEISQNNLLTSFSGLDSLHSIGSQFVFYLNPLLHDLQGLGLLTRIGSRFHFEQNQNLSSMQGLGNLSYIGENFWVFDNPMLVNFAGLESLDTVNNVFLIEGNGIVNLEGLSSLRFVENDFTIKDNPNLVSFDGLDSLDYVYSLAIINNAAIRNLNGLEHIRELDVDLDIAYNPLLETLQGLHVSEAATILNVSIEYNPVLSVCDVPSICAYIANSIGNIHDNAVGCQSGTVVRTQCMVAVGDMTSSVLQVYPNPAAGFIRVDLEAGSPVKFSVSDLQGNLCLTGDESTEIGNISVDGLKSGFYMLHVYDKAGRMWTGKFVKH